MWTLGWVRQYFAPGAELSDDLHYLHVRQILESQTWAGHGGLELGPLGTQLVTCF